MKRFLICLLVLFCLFSLTGCIRIEHKGQAVLKFKENGAGDNREVTASLTEEETSRVKAYLTSAKYEPGIGGCYYNENTSITFGNQVFLIAMDGCNSIRAADTDPLRHYTLSEDGWQYITSLYLKYVGYFPS